MARVPLPEPEPMKLTRLADIARGGMGSVELARVEEGRLAGEVLAIKRLHASIAGDPQFVSMFLDEAWLTSSLRHPNVVEVAALGTDERGLFLAIEFVQGVSLARLLKEAKQNQEPFAERTVAHICSQVCAGLTAAHDLRGPDGAKLGLVHRDLAPANVLIRFDGMVKIIDFGIAKAEERITHTRTGQLKGKPAYMAPEQARGRNVDQRADIFSFGVMMFEFLAGRRPWMSKAAFDVMMQIMNEPTPDLAVLRPGLNPEFIAIVNKCLEKNPDDRFSSASEIQARLDEWRTQKGFMVDDQRSLASFVVRNSQAQIKWFEAALGGHIELAPAPTFKELEEQIDAEREAKDGPNRRALVRPAAGRRVEPPALTPTRAPEAPPLELPVPVRNRPLSLNDRLPLPPARTSAPPPEIASAPPPALASAPPPAVASVPPPGRISTPPPAVASVPPPGRISTPPPAVASVPPPAVASVPPPGRISAPPLALADPVSSARISAPPLALADPASSARISAPPLALADPASSARISAPPPGRISAPPPEGKPQPIGDKRLTDMGTEYMAISPLASMSPSTPPPRTDSAEPSPVRSSSPPPLRPSASPAITTSAPPLPPSLSEAMDHPSSPGPGPSAPPGPGTSWMAPAEPPSRRTLIALVILIVVLAVGVAFVWQKRIQRLFQPNPPASTASSSPQG